MVQREKQVKKDQKENLAQTVRLAPREISDKMEKKEKKAR